MLFSIKEQSDVFVDACVADVVGQLLFLSVFGRDTSLQQMFARFQLRANEGGIDALTVIGTEKRMSVTIGDPNRLQKLTGRLPRETLFGNIAHAWVFDAHALEIDRANGAGWILVESAVHGGAAAAGERRWRLVQLLARVPLLEAWRDVVLSDLGESAWHTPAYVGRVVAEKLALPDDFERRLTRLLRAGRLAAPLPLAA